MHDHEDALETGIDEPIHTDPVVRSRMSECTISTCEHGCKYYHDRKTGLMVLGHNSNYGCRVTQADILESKRKIDA
ncbi:hypothetical protein PBI_GRAVY_48 [Gordonia phage Gravy]|uniref:Uncharacterized protein n=4 Tax=Tanisvirus tanis TaxID=2844677 RepID=A0A7D5G3R4_9CAUD|nr:hypothetical protein HWC73_gp49 [Gordonia phage Tanis]AVO25288.1 hypothetical protein PBI_GRAVY_48 [Gordonia phage Gravy]AVO25381.1 hypothetical protein PBI_KERRY_48 [Gordonia phage Kerry]QKY78720.1 hypothetical protein SEA_GILL_49 [Gordonia phage Gill]QLF83766.1 hypothetical protein SEA_MAGEL_50 [Gordonia phage Magel]QFP95623.1 hypothetical protein SEA_TANIS_49 [Gordonia phage Tanis]